MAGRNGSSVCSPDFRRLWLAGTTIAATVGGVLVVGGVVLAALAVPAFLRYRPPRRDSPKSVGGARGRDQA